MFLRTPDESGREPTGLAIDDGTRRRTWAEFSDRTIRVARYLREDIGLCEGDRIALLMDNRVEVVELVQGAILAGLWVTPINWHLAPDEVAYIVEDSGAQLLVSDDRFNATAREVASAASCQPPVVLAGDELDRALAGASDEPLDPDSRAGGNMIYTSGTTGRPKGVKRAAQPTLAAAMAFQRRYGETVGLDGSGPHLITGPMYHAAPLMFAIYDQSNGAPIVIMPKWDERACLETIREREVAHTHLVPTMFVRLLRLPEEERARFATHNNAPRSASGRRLSLVLHGAAPISLPVKKRMIDWWGEVLVEYWGATEGGVTSLIGSAEWLGREGSVGRALPAFEVFAVDEQKRRLPAGEVGELYCRHKTVEKVFEYHGDPEKTQAAFLEPGVFTIGDIGWLDADGYVYLADRRSNMIISGGVNIYPAEIESVLQEHPAVADVGVFGVPDEEWGESVKAAVQLAEGHTASAELEGEILAFAREHLAGYKVPRSLDFEAELPRDTTGKLYIRRLRDRYWQGRERQI